MKRRISVTQLRAFVYAVAFIVALGFGLAVPAAAQDASSKGSEFSDSDINSLFGTFQEESEKKEDAAPKRVLPAYTGNYKVLVSRPMYAVYEAETKTKWISALGEIYTHYRVGAFPRTHVYTMEQVSGVLPGSRDYGKRFNKQHYIDAAKKLGATHLIYQEYQPQKDGKRSKYLMELYWIAEGAVVERSSVEFAHNDIEGGLNACLGKIADAMDSKARSGGVSGVTVLGKDLKTLEAFGNALAGEERFVKERAEATYEAIEKTVNKNSGLTGFSYAGALVAGRAENFEKAVRHIEAVIGKSKDYPALQLRLAEYQRGAKHYSEAVKAAEAAAKSPALKVAASIEMAMVSQAQGNLDRARSEYETVLSGGEANSRVLFMLALLSIQMGKISESEDYLRRAEESGLALDEGEYLDLGKAYANAGGYEDKAVEYLKKSMGPKQSNEDAWEAIADLYSKRGNDAEAAEAYVNLFKINMEMHSGKLKMAGEIFEKIGMTDKAKDAYALFVDRRFSDRDVSMNLARIYFNEKDCKKVKSVLEGLKGYEAIPEATQMLEDCGLKVRRIDESQTLKTKKLSPLMLTARIGGATLLAGGVTVGLIMNSSVSSNYENYKKWDEKGSDAQKPEKVKEMRDNIDSGKTWRDVMYVFAGVGLAGFAVTFFF
jgi:tetratricopeptide (TPR) repeat protein